MYLTLREEYRVLDWISFDNKKCHKHLFKRPPLDSGDRLFRIEKIILFEKWVIDFWRVYQPANLLKNKLHFSTRRGASVRRSSSHRWADDMSQIDMTGYVDRKQELQSGGRRATLRSWKNYYTILCGQLLCFFKVYWVENTMNNGKNLGRRWFQEQHSGCISC